MNDDPSLRAVSPLFPISSDDGDVAEAVGDVGPQGDGGDDLVESGEVEVQPKIKVPTPEAPTASELAEHRDGGHMPYRPWCEECVEAFGKEDAHAAHDRMHKRQIPMIALDYLFFTSKGIFTRIELQTQEPELFDKIDDDNDDVLKILVVFDSSTKCVFAHAVRRKGAEAHVVQQIVDDISWIGHTRLVLRSDNEPAILALITDALRGLRVQMDGLDTVAAEGSVPYDPQTNGAVESAVKNIKQSLRANLLTLERRLQARIPPSHIVVTWLVRHSAMMRLVRMRGRDGKTGYERARGTQCTSKLLGFGEMCRYKCRSREGAIAGTSQRFSVGVWLGLELKTGQYILWDPKLEGIRHSRTLMRLPDADKFDRDKTSSVALPPWSLHRDAEPHVRFPERPQAEQEVKQVEPSLARRVYIRQKDLDDFGYTTGCPKCEHTLRYGPNRSTLNHSDRCRDRITARLAETPEGRHR